MQIKHGIFTFNITSVFLMAENRTYVK